MSTNAVSKFRQINDFPELVEYLGDELDWPIQTDDFEEMTFEYSAEELGLDAKIAPKFLDIRRLRPLDKDQPWGIFFIRFGGSKLPVVALRRLLSKLALKKRSTSNAGDRASWHENDLLLISQMGGQDEKSISFAHFASNPEKTDLPILKVLGWDNDDTGLKIDYVIETLREKLIWPDDPTDSDAWRAQWRDAFTLKNREVIQSSKEMAVRLGQLALAVRTRLREILAIENDEGPIHKLMSVFKENLISDLDTDSFSDMYAQTIAYGLLSARIINPKANTVDAAHTQLPITNPFLRELMETFLKVGGRSHSSGVGLDFDELGINEVVDLLDNTNMEAVLRDFGDRNQKEDPVMHFFEGFLQEYDSKIRKDRGVFYTPQPVVSFIVRSVDEQLRTEFGLEDGLADTTTWRELAARTPDLEIPIGTSPDQGFVQILDPATGTGTFPVEVIDLIYKTMTAKWQTQGIREAQIKGLWNEYVPKHLLPRLHGYELMMAPYAIAHMKIGLKLYETGYRFESDERARIYLTNALEPAQDFSGTLAFAIPALAQESEAVNVIKRGQMFTVVIGNPPYANYSSNLTQDARSIVDCYRNFQGAPIRERNQLQFERNLQDDFVKFIAMSEKLITSSTRGILGFITNATILGSNSLRGMREHLRCTFDNIRELHLHGGTNEIGKDTQNDENVFEISQAVAVHLYCRSAEKVARSVRYADMYGRRREKYEHLLEASIEEFDWQEINPNAENCGFVPQDDVYPESGFPISDCFSQFGAGIKTNRDSVAIGFTTQELISAVTAFDPSVAKPSELENDILTIQYRPFDYRKVFYHKQIVKSRSLPTMQHMLAGSNLGFLACTTWTTPERFSVGCSRHIVEMKSGTHDRGTTLFPLYRYESILGEPFKREHNFTKLFLDTWFEYTGIRIIQNEGNGSSDSFAPETIFYWMYALFYAASYRSRYRATLARGFPVVLFPCCREFLLKMSEAGKKLTLSHFLELPFANERLAEPVSLVEATIEKVSFSDMTVWIDKDKSRGFRGVSTEIWNFHVGGYQVCEKWLKDRQTKAGKTPRSGRVLSAEDILHYRKIVAAISETIGIMTEIDQVIEAYGDWPDAFVASKG